MPENAPTWVNLDGVVGREGEVQPETLKPLHCPTGGILVRETFQDRNRQISNNGFQPNLGAEVEIHGTFWEVQNRRSTYSGARLDLSDIRDCLDTSEMYEITMKFRMEKEGYEGTPTACAAMGTECIHIYIDYMKDSLADQITVSKYSGPQNVPIMYGANMTITFQVAFGEEELASTNEYLSLRISGGELDTDIAIDDFSLRMTKENACGIDCRDLVCNGHAEYEGVFPFSGAMGNPPTIWFDEIDENHFWHVEDGGITWEVPPKCMVENSVWIFQMRLRSYPSEGARSRVDLMVYFRPYHANESKFAFPLKMFHTIYVFLYI
jgi:hypothetical protein